jgi:hypothetical protein
MTDVTVSPGFTLTDVGFSSVFDNTAASARLVDTDNADPFKWRLLVGKFAASAGQQAFKTTCTFKPKGAPAGTTYGIKQIAYHKFLSIYYRGLAEVDDESSQTLGTTSVNFTWNLDCAGSVSASGMAIPSLPFFSALPSVVANGAPGSLSVIDSPGGTARLVRANLLTSKRNYLRSYGSATDFITALVVVLPNNTHIPVRAISWKFSSESTIDWQDKKPTLRTVGICAPDREFDPAELADFRLAMFKNNAMRIQDTILFKVNQGLTTAEMGDAGAPVTTNWPRDEREFDGGTYKIVHSRKLLL